ncbi:MAG TPA: DMT family transporter [Limnobacter sp.]|nr:DMT family transporter [Limnobacter sp.]
MQALWMFLACLCFGTMGLMIKLAAGQASLGEIVLFRGLVPLIVLAGWARIHGLDLKSPVAHLHLRRNLAGILAMWCGFYATTQLPLATATTLMYTSPLFIALLLWCWFGQVRNRIEKSAIAMGFVGVVAVLQPVLDGNQLGTALIGLAGGAISAIAYLQLKSLGQAKEPEWRTVMYFGATAAITGGTCLLITGDAQALLGATQGNSKAEAVLWLLGLGLFGGAGNLALTRSFGAGSTWMSAALQYCTILVSTFYGIVVLGDIPTQTTWLGALLIIACGGLSAYATHHRQKSS